ncbi:glycosyltransferase family 2 protein [Salipiger aestuarii]|uniref:glycosyltransferase family 2 protein n=1 Tax=Salipiger aestuarii TaxID=568098 RepID=UPI00123C69F3|nr:glycosyltransferase family 2 protein [Salipiger aestuarii]KAA8610010.1 hypothetical protein AL037_14230 [Salipiger aestuarii]
MPRLPGWMPRLSKGHSAEASWSVVATVAEPPELLWAFAAHYLGLGAEEVHLFIDDPAQPGLEPLRALPGVRLTICDEAHWQAVNRGTRPPAQEMRQIRNANTAYRACRSDWLLHCDADEYLWADRPVAEILGEIPADTLQVRPHMAERAFDATRPQAHLFDGLFKTPLPKKPKVIEAVYGPLAGFTTAGLLGHLVGKSFTRAGRDDLRIKIHMAVPKAQAEETRLRAAGKLAPGPRLKGCRLVHFDGLTPLHWKLKLLRYALDYGALLARGVDNPFPQRLPARRRQIAFIHEAEDKRAAFDALTPLLCPPAGGIDRLRAASGLLEVRFDPGAAAREIFADSAAPEVLAFPVDRFDADLRARKAEMIERYGL